MIIFIKRIYRNSKIKENRIFDDWRNRGETASVGWRIRGGVTGFGCRFVVKQVEKSGGNVVNAPL